MSIVEFFKVTLNNIGKTDVQYTTGGMLQRRKSKVPLLDVPKVIFQQKQNAINTLQI